MQVHELDLAIDLLCQRFDWHCDVEILLVGGAALMLTGLVGPDRVTIDCDVIDYNPHIVWSDVELLAESVGIELGLPDKWFNSTVQIRLDCLPNGWKSRRVLVQGPHRLKVYAASRPDLIAMKFMAGRPRDLEDLQALNVTEADLNFVRNYFEELPAKGTPADQIVDARAVVDSWISKS